MLKRSNKACKYFPCHKGLEDCTFCYCPFYPCLNTKLGRYVYSPKRKSKVWSCQPCSWIHSRRVVERISALIRKNKSRIKSRRIPRHPKVGVIILSHGSRLKRANAILADTVKTVRRYAGSDLIIPAYFQFCRPDLRTSARRLVARGCRKVVIVPFFLFNGNHVTRDVPLIIEKERGRYPKVDFVYTKGLGEDARIADIVADIVEEAVHNEDYS